MNAVAPLSQLSYVALAEEALASPAKDADDEEKKYVDSALSHIYAFNEGEDFEQETGILHLAHARVALGQLIKLAYGEEAAHAEA
jgi:hypothetical protein